MTVASDSSAAVRPQSKIVAPKMRVLFVEDDDDCREALSAELGDHGLEVESFRDGRSMLEGLAAKADADVALLDWNLPDIQGIDLALELKSRSANRMPPAAELEERAVSLGRLTLRPQVSRALWGGRDVDLTLTEYKIVALLVGMPGRFVNYREVYDCMHYVGFMAGGGDDGFRTNVRSALKRIRNKFRALAPDFAEIENHPGIGYRWRPQPA